MSTSGRRRWGAPVMVVLALIGAWAGHTVEYVRSAGAGAQLMSPFAGVHAYMLPVMALLVAAAVIAGVKLWDAWVAVGRALDGSTRRLRRAWRNSAVEDHDIAIEPLPSTPARLVSVWATLTLLQIGIYTVQENLEAEAMHRALPGFGAITGVHTPALLVHAAIALIISAALVIALWPIRQRASLVTRVERLLRHIVAFARRAAGPQRLTSSNTRNAAQWLGSAIWCRPPPLPA